MSMLLLVAVTLACAVIDFQLPAINEAVRWNRIVLLITSSLVAWYITHMEASCKYRKLRSKQKALGTKIEYELFALQRRIEDLQHTVSSGGVQLTTKHCVVHCAASTVTTEATDALDDDSSGSSDSGDDQPDVVTGDSPPDQTQSEDEPDADDEVARGRERTRRDCYNAVADLAEESGAGIR